MTSPRYGEPIVPEPAGGRLTLAELERAVWAADPAAFLVLPRILRRVIKQDRRLAGFGLRVPHRKSYVIGREPLLEIVEKADLGVADDFDAAREGHSAGPARSAGVLRHAGRRSVDPLLAAAVSRPRARGVGSEGGGGRADAGGRSPADSRDRHGRVRRDPHGARPGGPAAAAAVATNRPTSSSWRRTWNCGTLPRASCRAIFPGLEDLAAVDELIGRDVDAEGLFRATRPDGRARSVGRLRVGRVGRACRPRRQSRRRRRAAAGRDPFGDQVSRLDARVAAAGVAGQRGAGGDLSCAGRAVRAAGVRRPRSIGHQDGRRPADPPAPGGAGTRTRPSPQPWQESLFALVSQTPRGIWTVEARLLYDLQKVCVDHERDIYTVDLVEWALSWGRRPIKRQLPSQRDVLMLKHLRSAARRLAVGAAFRRPAAAACRAGARGDRPRRARLRQRLRPQITAALDEVGLTPQNLPERVARKKLVEELLDQIGERGFLTMGDLRDAISRNNLKLPDLSEPLRLSARRPVAAGRPQAGAGARRRLSARRVLLALDAAAQFAGVRHAHRAAF